MTAAIAALMHWLVAPWDADFVRRAFGELVLLAVVGGTLGCWVVLFGLSYGAESLSHAMFPGLVAVTLTGGLLIVGGLAGVLVAAVAIAVFGRTPVIGRDTSIAIVVSTLFGVGVLMALSPNSPPGIDALLFGNILGISAADLAVAAGLTVAIGGALILLHRQLLVVGFDRIHARALGGNPLVADTSLLILLGMAVVVSAQGVGTLLAPAVLIGPAATARLLTRRMAPMMGAAIAFGIGAGAAGLYLSFYAGSAAGASIAGTIVAAYVVVALITRGSRSRP